MTQRAASTRDQTQSDVKARSIKKPHELRVACGQDVILIFLVSTFSSASLGKYDASGISSIIPGIQGDICFLVMVSEENYFF